MITHNTKNNNITINTIMEDNLFQDYCLIKNLTINSQKAYATALRAYIISQNSTLQELIDELSLLPDIFNMIFYPVQDPAQLN